MELLIPRNTMIVLCGPAGCGKSTFAAKHFQPTEIVSSDHCRAMICDDPTNQAVSADAFELMRVILEKRLAVGRLSVADATHLDRSGRTVLTKLGRAFSYNMAVIAFDVSLETCLGRNAGRKRIVPEDAVRRQHTQLERTLRSLPDEDFDQVFVLNEDVQSRVAVRIGRRVHRRTSSQKL
jgi:protein phosphatase